MDTISLVSVCTVRKRGERQKKGRKRRRMEMPLCLVFTIWPCKGWMDEGMYFPLALSGGVSKFGVPISITVIIMLTASPYKHLDLMCTCHHEQGNVVLPQQAIALK